MRSFQVLASAVALSSHVFAQTVDSKPSCDSVTKICYSSYTTPAGVTYSIALPSEVTNPYDAIISITAPVAIPWAGFAWGGTMVFNPLTVAWANGNTAVVSSREAFGLSLPNGYDGAEYTLLKGTMTNATHWTMTARCRGCTNWQDTSDNTVVLNGTGTVQFAWAQGGNAVAEPANNASAFNVHQAIGKWNHDLNAARSPNFNSWIASNLAPVATTTGATTTSKETTTSKPTTLTTSIKPVSTGKAIPASCSGAGAAVFQSVLASGWKATKVIGGLTNPRGIIFDTAGNLLMVQNGKGITVHGIGADGCITSSKTLVSLNSLNHGIQLSADGKTLYASSATAVWSWPYTASSTSVGTRANVVTNMFTGVHTSRTLLIAPHQPNLLLVSHGSISNWDYEAGNPKTGRATIKVFDLNAIPSGGYNWVNSGYLAGYGLRNEIGITFDGNNMMWGVENSGDDFTRTPSGQTSAKDVHQNNPAEKLNYLGDVTKPNNNWYGYPTCFAVWQPSDFTDAKFQVGDHFVVAPNNTFKDVNCNTLATAPSTVFQAHSAPIDAKFDATYSNLYVTFHGSWDRSPTTGFKLVQIPFTKGTDGAYKPVAPLATQTGYTDIFWNPDVTKCNGNGPSFSSGCFRPAGLLFDSSGRLYMTSDTNTNAELWILGKS